LVILLIILGSCGGYNKVLKSSDANLKYRKAFEYYNKEDYSRASTLFEDILNVFRGTIRQIPLFIILPKVPMARAFMRRHQNITQACFSRILTLLCAGI